MFTRNNGWSKAASASARRGAKRRRLGRYSAWKRKNRQPKPTVTYRDYIESDAWQAKREQYTDGPLPKHCLACGAGQYQLHHVTYDRLGFELLSDLAPLCRECHSKVHRCDPLAGKNDLRGLQKSLIYDFGIGTPEVRAVLTQFYELRSRELKQLDQALRQSKRQRHKPRFR